MSGPISARITSAVRWLTPGIVVSNPSSGEKGAATRATSALRRPMVSSIWSMRASISVTSSP
jgi:hypothetical protein